MYGSRLIKKGAILVALLCCNLNHLSLSADTTVWWTHIADALQSSLPTVKVTMADDANPYLIPDGAVIKDSIVGDTSKYKPSEGYTFKWEKGSDSVSNKPNFVVPETIAFNGGDELKYTLTVSKDGTPVAMGEFVIKKSDIVPGDIEVSGTGVHKEDNVYYTCLRVVMYSLLVSAKGGSGTYKYQWQIRYPSGTNTWTDANKIPGTAYSGDTWGYQPTDTSIAEIRCAVLDIRDTRPMSDAPATNYTSSLSVTTRRQFKSAPQLSITGVAHKTGTDAKGNPTYDPLESLTGTEVCDGDKVKVKIGDVSFDRGTFPAASICTPFTGTTFEEGKGYQVSWRGGAKGSNTEQEITCDFGTNDALDIYATIYEPEGSCGNSINTAHITVTKTQDLKGFKIESSEAVPQPTHCRGEEAQGITLSADKDVPTGENIVYQWYKSTTDKKPLEKGYKPKGTEVYEATHGWELMQDSTSSKLFFGTGNFLDTTAWYCLKVKRNSHSCSDSVYSQPLSIKTEEPMVVSLDTCNGTTCNAAKLFSRFVAGKITDASFNRTKQLLCPDEFGIEFNLTGSPMGYDVFVLKRNQNVSGEQFDSLVYVNADDATHKTDKITSIATAEGKFTLYDTTYRLAPYTTSEYKVIFKSKKCPTDTFLVHLTMQQPEKFAIKGLKLDNSKPDIHGNDSVTIKVGEFPHIYLDPYTDDETVNRGATGGKKDYTYQWQDSVPGGKWTNIVTVNNSWTIGCKDTLLSNNKTPCVTYYRVIVKDQCETNSDLISDTVSVHVVGNVPTPTIAFGLSSDTLVCKGTQNPNLTLAVRNADTIVQHLASCEHLLYRWDVKYAGVAAKWHDTIHWTECDTTKVKDMNFVVREVPDTIHYRLVIATSTTTDTANLSKKALLSNELYFTIPSVLHVGYVYIGHIDASGNVLANDGVGGAFEQVSIGSRTSQPLLFMQDTNRTDKTVSPCPRGGHPFELTDEGVDKFGYKYQWQYANKSADDISPTDWHDIDLPEAKKWSYWPTIDAAWVRVNNNPNLQFRCCVTDQCGTKYSQSQISILTKGPMGKPHIVLATPKKRDTMVCQKTAINDKLVLTNLKNILDSITEIEKITFCWYDSLGGDINKSRGWVQQGKPLGPYAKTIPLTTVIELPLSTVDTTTFYRLQITSDLAPGTIVYSDTVTVNVPSAIKVTKPVSGTFYGCKDDPILPEFTFTSDLDVDTVWQVSWGVPLEQAQPDAIKEVSTLHAGDRIGYYQLFLTLCTQKVPAGKCVVSPWLSLPTTIASDRLTINPKELCSGENSTLTFDSTDLSANEVLPFKGAPTKTYTWQFSPDVTAVPKHWEDRQAFTNDAAIPSAFTYTFSTTTTGWWRMSVKDACDNVVNSDSLFVAVNPLPVQTTLVTPQLSVCKREQVVYHILSPETGTTYSWSVIPADAGTVTLNDPLGTSATILWLGLNTTVQIRVSMQTSKGCDGTLEDVGVEICNDSVPLPVKVLRKPGGKILVASIEDTTDRVGYYVWGRGADTLQKGNKRYFIYEHSTSSSAPAPTDTEDYWVLIKRDSTSQCQNICFDDGSYESRTNDMAAQFRYTILVNPKNPSQGDNTTVDVPDANGAEVSARLYEPRGMKVLRSGTVRGDKNAHITLPMNVPKGLYLLEVQVGDDRETVKLLVR